jgi:hypothetical protein
VRRNRLPSAAKSTAPLPLKEFPKLQAPPKAPTIFYTIPITALEPKCPRCVYCRGARRHWLPPRPSGTTPAVSETSRAVATPTNMPPIVNTRAEQEWLLCEIEYRVRLRWPLSTLIGIFLKEFPVQPIEWNTRHEKFASIERYG